MSTHKVTPHYFVDIAVLITKCSGKSADKHQKNSFFYHIFAGSAEDELIATRQGKADGYAKHIIVVHKIVEEESYSTKFPLM